MHQQPSLRARQIARWVACSVAMLVGSAEIGPSQDAVATLHKMQAALGGAERIAAIRDLEEFVRAESWNGNTGQSIGEVRKRTRWINPNVLRVDQIGAGSTYILFFNGTDGWEILPGTDRAVPLEGGELEFARKYLRNFRLRTWLADRDRSNHISLVSPNVLRISDGDILDQQDLTLDPVTALPIQSASITLSDPQHPIASQEMVSEWETVQGVRFPRQWTVLRDGKRVAEAHEARHTINAGLQLADLARRPADSKPEIPPQ